MFQNDFANDDVIFVITPAIEENYIPNSLLFSRRLPTGPRPWAGQH
jgi:hypothetical protein